MTQQDYINQEISLRPEAVVSNIATLRRQMVERSVRTASNACSIIESTNSGQIYNTASKWAERSEYWANNSDLLSPVVEKVMSPTLTQPIDEAEIQLSKNPPSFAETAMYLDELNADNIDLASEPLVGSVEYFRGQINDLFDKAV